MRTTLPLFFFLLLLINVACSEDESANLSYETFEEHLRTEMTYGQLVLHFGKPFADVGSGIHIYEYHLDDQTKIFIGYTDQILYARHVSADGRLLHELI
ncbi:MAG TPA: hypothetical protein VFW11_19875 [Cyclobacteriaceae bacterium]|nr:hypothetical protein [Cyclobacteriaceae bacterium]